MYEEGYVLHEYQTKYPILSELDPTTVIREAVVELGKLIASIAGDGDGIMMTGFGKGIASAVAVEYANLDSGKVVSPAEGVMIMKEASALVLDIADAMRATPGWYSFDFTLLGAQYMTTGVGFTPDLGFVIRYRQRLYNEAESYSTDLAVSNIVITQLRVILGR